MLSVVATPIGNKTDITQRARDTLATADLVIGEERAPLERLLKSLSISPKSTALLNEHSTAKEVSELANQCESQNVALVSDCGTPGFCDPGANLIQECRKKNIKVMSVPGPSALMTLLSLSSQNVKEFLFKGFLPQEREERIRELSALTSVRSAIVLMDTPYRLSKLITECAEIMPKRRGLLGMDLTMPEELIVEDSINEIAKKVEGKKAEFMLLIYPDASPGKPSGEKHRQSTKKRIE